MDIKFPLKSFVGSWIGNELDLCLNIKHNKYVQRRWMMVMETALRSILKHFYRRLHAPQNVSVQESTKWKVVNWKCNTRRVISGPEKTLLVTKSVNFHSDWQNSATH